MTSKTTPGRKRGRLMISLSLIALSLAGCNKRADQLTAVPAEGTQPVTAAPIAALPLATAVPPELAPAPEANQLPWPSRPIRIAQRPRYDRYGYIDSAYDMSYAFADAPPDYTVDYDGIDPWIWRADNGAYRIVEWLPYGERDYYYGPGEDDPFFVSDPYYSYAYDGDVLVGLYDPSGYPLDFGYGDPRAYNATRYLYRARDLYRAANYRQRRSAYAEDWLGRRDDLIVQRQRWEQRQRRDPDWQSWRGRHESDQRLWRPERDQRMVYAMATDAGLRTVRDRMERRGGDRAAQPRWAGFGDQGGLASRGQPQRFGQWQPDGQRLRPNETVRQDFVDRRPRDRGIAGDGFFRQRQAAMQEQRRLGGVERDRGFGRQEMANRQGQAGRFARDGFFQQREATMWQQRRQAGAGGGHDVRFDRMRGQAASDRGRDARFTGNRWLERRQADLPARRQAETASRSFERARQQQMFEGRRQAQEAMRAQFARRERQRSDMAAQFQRQEARRGMEMQWQQRSQQQQQARSWQQGMQERMAQHQAAQQQRAQARQAPQGQPPNGGAARFAQMGGGHDHGNGGGPQGGGRHGRHD